MNGSLPKDGVYKIVAGTKYVCPETVYNGNAITACTQTEADLARVGFPYMP